MNRENQKKKLLILAGSANSIDLVKRTRALGIYTIVTDYNESKLSPAKLIADEAWNISWSDLDLLEKRCLEEHVEGIIGGYSEFVVENVIKLCERLHLPCYCTEEQLEITRNKALFKSTCRRYHVPVIHEYEDVNQVDHYPVIVKPVDRAGSIGVSIANNKQELLLAVDDAIRESKKKQIIIEDYIENGKKFDAEYCILDGKIHFLSCADTIFSQKNGHEKVIQNAWIYPSRYENIYREKCNCYLQDMIRGMGIKAGYINFSGFVLETAEGPDFAFFETGFRLDGGHSYAYYDKKGIVNVLDIFILYALNGNCHDVSHELKPFDEMKAISVNYYATEGTIKEICGMESIARMPDCVLTVQSGYFGQKCDANKAILSKMGLVGFCSRTPDSLADNVAEANRLFEVVDDNDKNIVYDYLNPETVRHWWE